jgi:hypothetical protein
LQVPARLRFRNCLHLPTLPRPTPGEEDATLPLSAYPLCHGRLGLSQGPFPLGQARPCPQHLFHHPLSIPAFGFDQIAFISRHLNDP